MHLVEEHRVPSFDQTRVRVAGGASVYAIVAIDRLGGWAEGGMLEVVCGGDTKRGF